MTIAPGGRCQYLYFIELPKSDYTTRHDLFYGVNLQLSFTF